MYMDKQLLKAYVRTIVEDEVRKVLPEILSEAISELKSLKQKSTVTENTAPVQKQKIDRSRLAALMGIDVQGDTLMATTANLNVPNNRLPENAPRDVPQEVVSAITKDYSALMKKLGIS
jgi:hypothetical protein